MNRLLRERSTAAMESLSATVDARDAYTAGHSRRVQQIALAIGTELGLSPDELEPLGHAALFHDIGKLAVPDAILLKPSRLDAEEWALITRHPDDGASIIERLGFLNDAVPGDPPPPRALRRPRATRTARRRGDPARRADHPRRRRVRLDALRRACTARRARSRRRSTRSSGWRARQFCPRVGAGACAR